MIKWRLKREGRGEQHTRLTSRNMETVKLTGSNYGADQPGSCPRREPIKNAKTWLEWLEMWSWYTRVSSHEKNSPKIIRNLGTSPQKCSPALS